MGIRTVVVLLALSLCAATGHTQIRGAGSTFAANLYANWNETLRAQVNSPIEYEPIGSGGGVKSVQERRTDFGATDRPLRRAELDESGLAQFPTAIGGVVLLANLPGIATDRLHVDAATLAGIYRGRLRRWDAPELQQLNPGINLPSLPIVPVFRTEGSGTSFAFTSFLSKQNAEFAGKVGPTATLTVAGGRPARTTADVSRIVSSAPGAIGYVDFAFALEFKLPSMQVRNAWGRYVAASRESIQFAMRAADWEKILIDQDPTFDLDLTDAPCPDCYPIATATFVLVPIKGKCANSARVLEFFEDALRRGDEFADKEGYVPLPSRAKNMIFVAMRRWYGTLEKSGVLHKPSRRALTEDEGPLLMSDADAQKGMTPAHVAGRISGG